MLSRCRIDYISLPCPGIEAMEAALALQKEVNKSVLNLHTIADKHEDAQVSVQGVPGV